MKTRRSGSPSALILGLGVLSLLAWVLLAGPPRPDAPGEPDTTAAEASRLMTRAIDGLRSCREDLALAIDVRTDLNRTGLIGLESSPITTSLGHLEAKRTSANPAFAGAVVRMFREAGVRPGDTVAVGASSSFPGLIVSVLCAARALDVRALPIISLGASNWGANDPRWTGLDIVECLNRKGLLDVALLAVSMGGEGDAGRDMPPEGREMLRRRLAGSGLPFIEESGLERDVDVRLKLFESAADSDPIRAFVNIGGSWVNMGTDSGVLTLRPGTNSPDSVPVPSPGRRGLIQEMALRGIPVIHLLHVRGLGERYGLPWDPVPLPSIEAPPSWIALNDRTRRWIALSFLFLAAAGLAAVHRRRRFGLRPGPF